MIGKPRLLHTCAMAAPAATSLGVTTPALAQDNAPGGATDDGQERGPFVSGSLPEIEQEGYFTANASLGLQVSDSFSVQAGVITLSDKQHLIQGNAPLGTLGHTERIFARPQHWYVQLSAGF
jgi:hypothetical protein